MEWIRLRDKHPAVYQTVLATIEHQRGSYVHPCYWDGSKWFTTIGQTEVPEPLAWQPMPAPFVEKGGRNNVR